MLPYIKRYPGPRWSILYSEYSGVEKFAIEALQRAVQALVPYVIEARPSHPLPTGREHAVLLGTPPISCM